MVGIVAMNDKARRMPGIGCDSVMGYNRNMADHSLANRRRRFQFRLMLAILLMTLALCNRCRLRTVARKGKNRL
jgi:hypothetical protein